MVADPVSLTDKAEAFILSNRKPLNSNTPWGQRYAGVLRGVFHDYAARSPRTLQVHLGPSELGVECHRQVAGKFAGLRKTNNVSDPWPSIRGTALHAYASDAFEWDNTRMPIITATGKRYIRWLAEQRVVPHPDHSGTADLYDAMEQAVVDHKFLGDSSLTKIQKPEGPPRHYVVQLLLYGLGYMLAGLTVKRVVLAAYPATKASLELMFVWDHPIVAEDFALLNQVFEETKIRRAYGDAIRAGKIRLLDVPATVSEDGCYFCPFYRPGMTESDLNGCPGTKGHRGELIKP
jgi:hypothetical protein